MGLLLKKVAGVFRYFGVEVKLIKKVKKQSALHLNDVNTVNKAWSNAKIEKVFYTKELQAFYERILNILVEKQVSMDGKSIVDVGCGTGMLLKFMKKNIQNAKFTGLEYSSAALEIAKRNFPEADFHLHDINTLYPEKFDIIISTEVLEHIQYPQKALNNLIDMLNPGGSLFISVPNGRIDTFEGHINFWSPESWNVFIEESAGGLMFETNSINDHNLYALLKK